MAAQVTAGVAETAAAKVVATAAATATSGAIVASQVAPVHEPSVWAIVVLGIPLGVLAAALAGSALRHLREPPQPENKLVPKMIGTVTDGFFGGWLAMLLITLQASRHWLGAEVSAEVLGALCALGMQFLRTKLPEWIDGVMKNLLSWFGKRGSTP